MPNSESTPWTLSVIQKILRECQKPSEYLMHILDRLFIWHDKRRTGIESFI